MSNTYYTRTDFFSDLGKREIHEIKKQVLFYTKNSESEYNELVSDFEYYIKDQIGIVPDVPIDEVSKGFTDYEAEELRPFTRDEVSYYKEFTWYDRDLIFDFINAEKDFIKVKSLKVSCKREDDTERIHKFEYGAFKFREACKMVIVELSAGTEVEKAKPKKLKKSLFQFIHNIENKEGFVQELKETFPTEIGKSIKAIIDILTKENILVIGTKEFKHFLEVLKLHFGRDIGEYQGIQNVKSVDKETMGTIYKKLNPLIIKYETS